MNFQYTLVVLLLVFGFSVTEDIKSGSKEAVETHKKTTKSPTSPVTTTTPSTTTITTPVTPPTTPSTTTTARPTTPSTTTTTKTTPVTPTTPPTTTTQIPPPSNHSEVLPVQVNPKHAESGKWIAMDKKNVSQIILETRATFHFQYNDSNKKPIEVNIYLPRNASVSLDQNDVDQKAMSLKWSLEQNYTNEVKFVFLKNESNYELHEMTAEIYPTLKYFVNYTGPKVIKIASTGSLYEMIPINASYVCVSDIVPDLMHSSNEPMSYDVKLSLTHFEAFMAKNSTLFNLSKECDMDGSQVVVIVVIVILIILIATVLAFYLVNRRRSQAQGYTSM